MELVTLAFLGDAVYELNIRCRIAELHGSFSADKLHLEAVKYVKASSQARALRTMIDEGSLSEDELDIARRARNRKPKSIPKNTDPMDYKLATAFEALLGWHHNEGRIGRVMELTEQAIRIIDKEKSKK